MRLPAAARCKSFPAIEPAHWPLRPASTRRDSGPGHPPSTDDPVGQALNSGKEAGCPSPGICFRSRWAREGVAGAN